MSVGCVPLSCRQPSPLCCCSRLQAFCSLCQQIQGSAILSRHGPFDRIPTISKLRACSSAYALLCGYWMPESAGPSNYYWKEPRGSREGEITIIAEYHAYDIERHGGIQAQPAIFKERLRLLFASLDKPSEAFIAEGLSRFAFFGPAFKRPESRANALYDRIRWLRGTIAATLLVQCLQADSNHKRADGRCDRTLRRSAASSWCWTLSLSGVASKRQFHEICPAHCVDPVRKVPYEDESVSLPAVMSEPDVGWNESLLGMKTVNQFRVCREYTHCNGLQDTSGTQICQNPPHLGSWNSRVWGRHSDRRSAHRN